MICSRRTVGELLSAQSRNRLIPGLLLFFLASGPALRADSLFQGIFSADDQIALFNFTVNAPQAVTIETFSYAGGTSGTTTVPAGGFAPTAFIFDNLGDVFLLTSGTCGQVNQDPTTLNCDDLFFQDVLGPGTFTLALAVDDNRPVDSFVADGFFQDGNPGFTCQEAGTSGNFCDVTTALGSSRTGAYALSITGADSATQLPEPGSIVLVLGGVVFFALLRRPRVNSHESSGGI
jgi:hypothetical protein